MRQLPGDTCSETRFPYTALYRSQVRVDERRTAVVDLDAAEATRARFRSIEQAVETEIPQLRETLARLNAQIGARSDEAVEESWRETAEALSATASSDEHTSEPQSLMRLSYPVYCLQTKQHS